MGARQELNAAYVQGGLIVAAIIGALAQSWIVFAAASVVLIGLHGGEDPTAGSAQLSRLRDPRAGAPIASHLSRRANPLVYRPAVSSRRAAPAPPGRRTGASAVRVPTATRPLPPESQSPTGRRPRGAGSRRHALTMISSEPTP